MSHYNPPTLKTSRPNTTSVQTKSAWSNVHRKQSTPLISNIMISSQSHQKEKMCSRTSKSVDKNGTELIINEKEKMNEKVKFVNVTEAIFEDDPMILECVHLLGTLNSHQLEDYKSANNWLFICDNKHKLERLLLEKIKLITDRDCLKLIQEWIEFVRKLESILGEDSYKLEIAAAIDGVKKKERLMSINNFKQTIENRRELSEEIEKKLESWIYNLNNINRLIDVTNPVSKSNLLKVIVKETIKEFDRIKISIAFWMSNILTTNLKIMVHYWDQMTSESLSNLCRACSRYNLLFPKSSINVIKIIAENQAKTVSSKIAFMLQTEVKKALNAKQRAEFKSYHHELSDTTSDYFTESTLSDPIKDDLAFNSIDLQNYLQIVIKCSQRVILKLAFSTPDCQTANRSNPSATSGSRQTWSKPDTELSVTQQKAFHYCDAIYWPLFWKNFKHNLIVDLVLLRPGVMATPMIMCPESYQALLVSSFHNTLTDVDFPTEAKNEMIDIYHECYYHWSAQQWLKSRIVTFQSNSN